VSINSCTELQYFKFTSDMHLSLDRNVKIVVYGYSGDFKGYRFNVRKLGGIVGS
jgi:hypothetical protein